MKCLESNVIRHTVDYRSSGEGKKNPSVLSENCHGFSGSLVISVIQSYHDAIKGRTQIQSEI